MLIGGRYVLTVEVLTGSEPKFPGCPAEYVLEPVVGVRAAAELGVVVWCDQARMPQPPPGTRCAPPLPGFGCTRDH